MIESEEERPLVYSCSGCSSAAQMANYLAIKLDRKGLAEMSCIAGVGGNVKNLVRTAKSGRKLIAIDGCPLACVKACLSNHSLQPDWHIELRGMGIAKKQGEDFDREEAEEILEKISSEVEIRFSLRGEKELA
ncbi:MAG: putative zinc-binding protein [Cyclobacteriaceae bacterium]|nr:putative zinc-binding protein [Cyclobacteriaceae bacterium]